MTITTAPPNLYGNPHGGTYTSGMARVEMVGIQKARETFSERVGDGKLDSPHTVVTKRTDPVAVIVPMEWYRRAREALGDPTDL